jgi:hypothetical protein
MTRTHCARQLLALGPLSFGEFVNVTGWPINACRRVLSYLVDCRGEVSRNGGTYKLTDEKLPDMRELEAKGKQADGSTEVCNVQPWDKVVILPANALVRETQAGCCGRCESAGGMECEGVTHG